VSGVTLETRDLALAYDGRQALAGISVALAAGEHVALLGPNGAGKSSFLRAITGVAGATSGAAVDGLILLDGQPLVEYSRATLARLIAVVPGQTHIGFPLLVEELVSLGRLPHEHPLLGPRPADRVAVQAAIERVGIDHLVGRDVRTLSLGERQLAVLAMAVAQWPRLLIVDEPTVHLDLGHRVAVMELLRDLSARDGVTVLAVLHDLGLAAHFFERVLLLEQGRLVADGQPTDVLTAGRVQATFALDTSLVGHLLPWVGVTTG
jgi:iron complex transport system ATP-binding protein